MNTFNSKIHNRENITHEIDNPIRVEHIEDSFQFRRALDEAYRTNPHGRYITMDYSINDYNHMDKILINDGAAGVAIKQDGDIVSVFKNIQKSEVNKIGKVSEQLLLEAIKSGGKKT